MCSACNTLSAIAAILYWVGQKVRSGFSIVAVVQLLSHVQLFVTPWTAACQASLSITISQFAQSHVH